MRGRYEGAWNVVRFNWPKYLAGLCLIVVAFTSAAALPEDAFPLTVVALVATTMVTLPLVVSHLIYDRSALYDMPWLGTVMETEPQRILNVNAGFDASSAILRQRFPRSGSVVVDLYDPERFTEASILRARRAYPAYPGTVQARQGTLPLQTATVDLAVAFLSLHEARTHADRVALLKEIRRTLKHDGRLVVTEHLRDVPNTLIFSFGVLHFHSLKAWTSAFRGSGFHLVGTHRTAGFITTFILHPA